MQLVKRRFIAALGALTALAGPGRPRALGAQHALTTAAQGAAQSTGRYDPAVPTPQSVLGYELGARFTPHHMLMRYLERVAAASRRVRLDTVARSFEGREVMLVTLTSEANQRRLASIRDDAARLADPRTLTASDRAALVERTPAIAWLGFTVHGPEASGAEAAIGVIYQLAAGQDPETRMVLDSTVVLIDPLENPDGHERHVQDVMRMRTALGVPVDPSARIHEGTWPGARTSHYYFDLNRDWYAQSHPETRGRVASMLRWHPQVAVDLHEMGYNSTYFFYPPMDPVNRIVPQELRRWWDVYARANIAAFDANGWSFFRGEGYDEFYPGYGSSWPLYNGAVGMTYEEASSRGGAIRRADGTILTLQDAARRHYAAAWATLVTTARNATARVRDYLAFRQSAIDDARRAPVRAMAFARDSGGRADSLAATLLANGIEVHRLGAAASVAGAAAYGVASPRAPARLGAGSYVVDYAQPQGRLARALLEPDAPLDSSFIHDELARREAGFPERFYDMTAWALPYQYRVAAWTLPSLPAGLAPVTSLAAAAPAAVAPARYGYAIPTGSEAGLRVLAGLLADSARVWYAPRAFRVSGTSFPHGAFVVRAAQNDSSVHAAIRRLATLTGQRVTPLASAAVDSGTDLGSNSVIPVRRPRIALLSGAPVSGQSFGYAWYALDQRLAYPSTAIGADAVRQGALRDFDVLVLPSTNPAALTRALGADGERTVVAWVRGGGRLIAIDDATDWLAAPSVALARLRPRRDTVRAAGPGAPLPVEVPGAIVRAVVDTLSPLTAGIDSREIPVLAFSDRAYEAPRNFRPGEIVVRYAPAQRLRIAGYLWPEVPVRLGDTPYLWTERVGAGRVIAFAGDPNFRALWRGLLPLFANALFLGASY